MVSSTVHSSFARSTYDYNHNYERILDELSSADDFDVDDETA